jgi:hypothetical protein
MIPPYLPPSGDGERSPQSTGPIIVTPAWRWTLTGVVWMIVGTAAVQAQPSFARDTAVAVAGTVTVTAADGAQVPADGARLLLSCRSESQPRIEIANADGAYRFVDAPSAGCVLSTALQGFRTQTKGVPGVDATELHFHLEIEPLPASGTVRGTSPLDASTAPGPARAPGRACSKAAER